VARLRVLYGDCRDKLREIVDGTIQCCVTSPPYWGLRSYLSKDHPDKHREIGQEKTPELYVETMVQVFREVKRCLHDSGTLWLNLGDSYASDIKGHNNNGEGGSTLTSGSRPHVRAAYNDGRGRTGIRVQHGLKPKDLCMIPWRAALALQQDGWWLRSVIVWHKKSCMPESVTDRPTNSWEPIFLLAKSARYFYDAEAVKEQVAECSIERAKYSFDASKERNNTARGGAETFTASQLVPESGLRNQRNLWSLGPEPYSEAHFATFPTEIPRRAILAGTSAKGCCPKCYAPWERVVERVVKSTNYKQRKDAAVDVSGDPMYRNGSHNSGLAQNADTETHTVGWQPGCDCDAGDPIPCTVLDPFAGSGTVGQVALELGRDAILIELNPGYLPLIEKRTTVTKGLVLA